MAGSLLPWISVYVFDGNLFNASNDQNLFQAVPVGNSISGGARAASAAFGLILIALAIVIEPTVPPYAARRLPSSFNL